jgi:MFS family permease
VSDITAVQAGGNRFTIAAAILLITLVGLSLSLFIPLLSIAMERMGVSGTVSGLNTAAAGVGTLVVVPFVPRLAARVGLTRVIVTALAVAAFCVLGFFLLPFWTWFPLRFLFGAAIGTLFVVSEYWITSSAPPERRGIVMGVYATMLSIGFAAGPLILAWAGTDGFRPYLAGMAIYAIAAFPLLLAQGRVPVVAGESHGPVWGYMTAVPVATFAGLVFGAVETGAFALFPVYGLRNGFNAETSALLISIVTAGNIVSQIPIGWLADSIDRRKVLLLCAAVGMLGAAAMPWAITDIRLFYAVLFVWGGFIGGIYTVGLAHLGARYADAELANANAAFVMLYSVGLIAGPPLVGLGVDIIGAHGFAWALAAMLGAYAALVLARLARN